ncbi:alpha/beta hydrolase [Phormidium tenue FACHB-886]|nr:alpha/beta hydrolase [Phormidium tenue FACHB-886]
MSNEIIAYHGWGFDRTCWQGWAALFEQAGIGFGAVDRGYFGEALEGGGSKIIFAHSYGLHLCPIAQLQQAELLVLFSSFATFHLQKESARRRSQQMLQQMLIQLQNDPLRVLDNFKAKCETPKGEAPNRGAALNPPLSNSAQWNLDLLVQDLKDLDECVLNLDHLKRLPQIVLFHGSDDRIVPVQKGQELANALSSNSQYIELAGAGHALPFTHLEQCWSVLRRILAL